jgi:hypothetical protein
MAGGSIVQPEGRYGSIDANMTENALPPGNGADKRAFTYFVLGGARFLYATAARLTVISVVSTLSASADVLALSSVEVDLSSIPMGNTVTVKWRGKVRCVVASGRRLGQARCACAPPPYPLVGLPPLTRPPLPPPPPSPFFFLLLAARVH